MQYSGRSQDPACSLHMVPAIFSYQNRGREGETESFAPWAHQQHKTFCKGQGGPQISPSHGPMDSQDKKPRPPDS